MSPPAAPGWAVHGMRLELQADAPDDLGTGAPEPVHAAVQVRDVLNLSIELPCACSGERHSVLAHRVCVDGPRNTSFLARPPFGYRTKSPATNMPTVKLIRSPIHCVKTAVWACAERRLDVICPDRRCSRVRIGIRSCTLQAGARRHNCLGTEIHFSGDSVTHIPVATIASEYGVGRKLGEVEVIVSGKFAWKRAPLSLTVESNSHWSSPN